MAVSITQKELTGYAKAMQEAGILAWAVDVEKPDGTRIRIMAGAVPQQTRGAAIDKMLGITHG